MSLIKWKTNSIIESHCQTGYNSFGCWRFICQLMKNIEDIIICCHLVVRTSIAAVFLFHKVVIFIFFPWKNKLQCFTTTVLSWNYNICVFIIIIFLIFQSASVSFLWPSVKMCCIFIFIRIIIYLLKLVLCFVKFLISKKTSEKPQSVGALSHSCF